MYPLWYCHNMEITVNCNLILYAGDSIIMSSDKDQTLIEQTLATELIQLMNGLLKTIFLYIPVNVSPFYLHANVKVQNFKVVW